MKGEVKMPYTRLNKSLSMEVYHMSDITKLPINIDNPCESGLGLITPRGEIQPIRLVEGLVLEITTDKIIPWSMNN